MPISLWWGILHKISDLYLVESQHVCVIILHFITEKSRVSPVRTSGWVINPTRAERRYHSCESLAKKCRHIVVTHDQCSEARSIFSQAHHWIVGLSNGVVTNCDGDCAMVHLTFLEKLGIWSTCTRQHHAALPVSWRLVQEIMAQGCYNRSASDCATHGRSERLLSEHDPTMTNVYHCGACVGALQ